LFLDKINSQSASLTAAVCEEVSDVTLSVATKTCKKQVEMGDAPSAEDVQQFAVSVGGGQIQLPDSIPLLSCDAANSHHLV